MRNQHFFPIAVLTFLLTQSPFHAAQAAPLPQSAFGSGVPLYGLYTDLTFAPSSNTWGSKSWLGGILSAQQAPANLKYLYPNYPYINYLAFDDPDNWSTYPTSDLYNTDCTVSGTWPVFFDYNVRTPAITNPDGSIKKSACYASGATANNVYQGNNQFKVLPQFSMDSGLTQAISTCYTNFAKNKTCQIPCASKSDGTNPVFSLPTNTCDSSSDLMTINNATQLDNMLSYTGKLIANLIANDKTANGVSFDIEGPALPDEGALNFYTGLVNQLNKLNASSKFIGVWEGVDVFENHPDQTQLLQNVLLPNNAFLIISLYDIGPDNVSPQTGIQDGGGLQVGQPPVWYSGLTVPNSQVAPLKLSAFELSLFGLSDGSFACHPASMMFYGQKGITGFNGCSGSLGFMNRMMGTQGNSPLPNGMPFQIGLPAISSTTEWVNTVMFYNIPDTTFNPTQQPINTAPVAVGVGTSAGWITNTATSCPFSIPIPPPKDSKIPNKIGCYVFQLANGSAYTQAQFLANGATGDGALNIIKKRTAGNAVPNWNNNFMGFYIYGLKDTAFDLSNCNTYFTKQYIANPKALVTGSCYANYPETSTPYQFSNTIPQSVWAAIDNFYKSSKEVKKKGETKAVKKKHA